jgi:MurNAc alpha-1-phosphate uridylyltransferase
MMTLALLCGGLATRLYPITKTIPKSMIEIAGEPFIAHQLRLFKKNGIERVVLCCGYLSEQIESFVGDGSKFDLQVSYSKDGDTLCGTGGALKKALPLLGDEFMVCYGDSYLDVDYQAIEEAYRTSGCDSLMSVFKNDGQWDASNVVFRDSRIVRYDKQLKDRDPMQIYDFIDYGIGIFSASLFLNWPSDVFDLAELYRAQVDARTIVGYEVFTRFYEIGSEKGIAETDHYLRTHHG